MVVYRCQYYRPHKLYICQKVSEKGSLTLFSEHQVSAFYVNNVIIESIKPFFQTKVFLMM
jgi:hypothetical protein